MPKRPSNFQQQIARTLSERTHLVWIPHLSEVTGCEYQCRATQSDIAQLNVRFSSMFAGRFRETTPDDRGIHQLTMSASDANDILQRINGRLIHLQARMEEHGQLAAQR